MNKNIIGLTAVGSVLCMFLFQSVFLKEVQMIDERFSDGTPKRISVYQELFNSRKKIRELQFWGNGLLRYDKMFKYKIPEGEQIFYPENGGMVTQFLRNGQRHGYYTEKDSGGTIIKQELWDNGQLVKILNPKQDSE